MEVIYLQTFVIATLGLMVGNELAVSVFIHPQLFKLEDEIHAAVAQSIARIYGSFMPFWYGINFIFIIAIAFFNQQNKIALTLTLISGTLWFLTILCTIIFLVPINNQITELNLDDLPSNWKNFRSKWDKFHAIRVFILTIALACITLACLLFRYELT